MAKSKRKKYDYHLIISSFGLQKEFNLYCKAHRKISFNRQARSFLVHHGVDFRKPCFELEYSQGKLEEIIRIAKTPWLD